VRPHKFAQVYNVDDEHVNDMLKRASRAGAISIEGEHLTVVNWKGYQDPRARSRSLDETDGTPPAVGEVSKSTRNDATHHQPPITNHQPPTTTKECAAQFDRFWESFPRGRKKSRAKAFEYWCKAIRSADPETIIASAVEYANSDEGRGAWVKMPGTWLNQHCWTDDREAWKDKANGNQPKRQLPAGQTFDRSNKGFNLG
jgi:hypothetical protein